jgi:hypothetical protein
MSMLEEELLRLRLEVWLVEMLAFTLLRERSMLEDELERLKLDV